MSTATSTVRPVLVAGTWRDADHQKTFRATDPNSNEEIAIEFPVSSWEDCDAALDAAVDAAHELRRLPSSQIAEFLERYADRIDAAKDALVASAFSETGLAKSPRLADVELPRTSNQLRAAAAACRSGSWALPTIDTAAGIRSCYESLGPICVFGPNNFPFAFGSVSGGDFAAAIAAGNPVIGKANSSHPETTRLFAEQAAEATQGNGATRCNGAADLSHGSRRWRTTGLRPTCRSNRVHRQPLSGSCAQSGGRQSGQTDLSRTFQRQSRGDHARRFNRTWRSDCRRVHNQCIDGDRTVLHQSRPCAASSKVNRATRSSTPSRKSSRLRPPEHSCHLRSPRASRQVSRSSASSVPNC